MDCLPQGSIWPDLQALPKYLPFCEEQRRKQWNILNWAVTLVWLGVGEQVGFPQASDSPLWETGCGARLAFGLIQPGSPKGLKISRRLFSIENSFFVASCCDPGGEGRRWIFCCLAYGLLILNVVGICCYIQFPPSFVTW